MYIYIGACISWYHVHLTSLRMFRFCSFVECLLLSKLVFRKGWKARASLSLSLPLSPAIYLCAYLVIYMSIHVCTHLYMHIHQNYEYICMYVYIYNQSKYFEPETSSSMSELRERIYIYRYIGWAPCSTSGTFDLKKPPLSRYCCGAMDLTFSFACVPGGGAHDTARCARAQFC